MASPAISSFNSSSLFSVVGLSLPDLPCDMPPFPSLPHFSVRVSDTTFLTRLLRGLPSPPLTSLFPSSCGKGGKQANSLRAEGGREGGDKNGVFEAHNHRIRTLEMLYGGTNCACLGYYEAFW